MRVLRAPDRAEAQQARRRRRVRELRQRESPRALPRRPRDAGPDRGRTPCRVRRRPPRADARRDADAAAGPAARGGRAVGAGGPLGDGASHPGRRLGVVVAAAVGCRGVVVRLAVPPGGRRERAPRREHDGHPGLARHSGCLGLVGRGRRARRGAPLPRVCGRRHDLPARRPLRGGVEQAAGGRCPEVADGARCQAGQSARRRGRATGAGRAARGR